MDNIDTEDDTNDNNSTWSVVGQWIVPVGSWLRGWIPYWTPEDHRWHGRSRAVAETLLAELVNQMNAKMEVEREREREENIRRMHGVDYSWLQMTPRPRPSPVSEVERLELEELFFMVLPEECTAVIRTFRQSIEARDPPSKELPGIMRAVVRQIMARRVEKKSSSFRVVGWIQDSLTGVVSLFPGGSEPSKRTLLTEEGSGGAARREDPTDENLLV